MKSITPTGTSDPLVRLWRNALQVSIRPTLVTDAPAGKSAPHSGVKTLRRALALTQEEFAARFRIPLGTLRDWEQGRSEPDQPAKAYLTVIARDPQGVERALHPVRS